MKNIGIFGGTFNPVHIGHLIAAQEVANQTGLDKIIFMPVGDPPHKRNSEVILPKHRLEMVKLAIENNDKFEICDIEIKRKGKTYTYDTLKELHNIYDDSEIFLIIGFDALRDIDSWKKVSDVFGMAQFIVVNRGNMESEMLEEIENKREKYDADIRIVSIPDIEVSSTDIRRRAQEGESIKYLVPDNVIEYMQSKNLYRGGNDE